MPEIVLLAANADEHFVHEPLVAWMWPAPLQRRGEQPPRIDTSVPDGLVAGHYATSRQDQFNNSQAQGEAMIQPDGLLDDLGREPEATIRIARSAHAREVAVAQPLPPT
jgi:hypothetical protein